MALQDIAAAGAATTAVSARAQRPSRHPDIRAGLEELTAANNTIVVGEVLESRSYWNDEGSFILTDVTVQVHEVLKGQRGTETVTVTLLGGTVGELTALILGVASLEPGGSYLLFLNEEDLPGARSRLTVRDHCQGAFDIVTVNGKLRARSQAVGFGLLPDAFGTAKPPGGHAGLELGDLMHRISTLAAGEVERRIP